MPVATVKDLIAIGKEVTEYVGISALVWRTFVFLHRATETVTKIPQFMVSTTSGLQSIQAHVETGVTNHLTHMEAGIEKLATSSERLADNMETMQGTFNTHVLDISNKQAVILDRLPNI
jgi:uncharacterized phage infection (PIP) family protein YhgE